MDSNALNSEDVDLFSSIPNTIPTEIVERYEKLLNQKRNERKMERDYAAATPIREHASVVNSFAAPSYNQQLNQQETSYNRVCDSIKEMEKRANDRITTASAGKLSDEYSAKVKYAKFLENNIGKGIDVRGQELSINENTMIDEAIKDGSFYTQYDPKFYEIVRNSKNHEIVAKRVTVESAAKAQQDADFYLNETAKYDYMTEAIAASNGDLAYINQNGDLVEVDVLDNTFMVSYNNYENAMNNLGKGNESYEQEVGFKREIFRNGKELHKQFGQSYAIASRLERDKVNSPEVKPLPSAYKYEILKRERALTDAQKAKVVSAITAGICIIGTVASFAIQNNIGLFNVDEVVSHELQALSSFESMVIYFKDLGPLTTLLSAASAGAIVKYFKNSKKLKNAQHDMEDFSTAYMNYVDELGSDQIDRTR